jgi:hypothetical protein
MGAAWCGRGAALLCTGAIAAGACGWLWPAAPAQAAPAQAASAQAPATPVTDAVGTDVQNAARIAVDGGYRTGVAVLDLDTGTYTGAGEDTAEFASESVVKVLLATELLLTGQMNGATETTAYQMITESDDGAADALYGLAGGDGVVDAVAAHYGITDLGSPPQQAGWWGDTQLTAKGLVQLYAAIAVDPVVGPWLTGAMAHTTEYAADGTYQFFGLPSATTGAKVKQGWGDDGVDSPNAVFDSTGFVDDGHVAVAILTDGPSSTYGSEISAMVTAQAKALMPGGTIAPAAQAPAATAAAPPAPPATASPSTAAASSTPDTDGTASGGSPSASAARTPNLLRGWLALVALGGFASVAGLVAVRHR